MHRSFYNPSAEFLAAKILNDVTSGDVVWVNVNSEQIFQSGGSVFPGRDLIALN
jgi:hypothetical protein